MPGRGSYTQKECKIELGGIGPMLGRLSVSVCPGGGAWIELCAWDKGKGKMHSKACNNPLKLVGSILTTTNKIFLIFKPDSQ
jgi:hypothetical protein